MTKAFAPIRDQRLSDKVTEQLLRAMRGGELAVGTRLPPEGQLATELGVSRGILREALTVLEARGFLKRTPKEGTIVQSAQADALGRALSMQLHRATYRDLLEFREVIECRSVESIVKNAADAEIDELARMIEDAPEGMDSQKVDRYFHYRLTELSGNSIFASCVDTYYGLISEIRQKSLQNERRRDAVKEEHLEIVAALRARDARAARNAVRRHINAVRQSLEENE